MDKKGQATTEIALIMPFFLILAVGAMSVAYMCYQGIKTQQAANLAARIQGQERVLGGPSAQTIISDNGTNMGGDFVPQNLDGEVESVIAQTHVGAAPPLKSVYGRYYKAAKDFFSPGDKVLVPPAVSGVNTDQIKVVRIMRPPKVLGLNLKPVIIEATAYGGEDTRMYGLPRWGTTNKNSPFYQSQIKE